MAQQNYVTVREKHKGLSHNSRYYFVIDKNKLMHISSYAVSRRKVSRDTVEYVIDLDMLSGKEIAEILTSEDGIFCLVHVYSVEDLRKRIEKTLLAMKDVKIKPLSCLNNLEFVYLTDNERVFLRKEWTQYYVPMLKILRSFLIPRLSIVLSSSLILPRMSILMCQIISEVDYPLSFLIPYSEYARRKSLTSLTKEIHQAWIATLMVIKLAELGRLKDLFLFFGFKHSSYRPIASFHCRDDLCSLWYEFDMNYHTMCRGMLWRSSPSEELKAFYEHAESVLRRRGLERSPLRPDIVILRGGESCRDLAKGFKVKMIVECKNQSYEYWARDVDTQIIPYKEIFQPEIMVVASLKKVPDHVKTLLSKHGITVIDEVYPGGRGEQELLQLVETL